MTISQVALSRSIAAVVALLSFAALPASAQIVGLGTLGGNVCSAENTNDSGAVIGTCRDTEGDVVAVYWAPGTTIAQLLTPLEPDGPCDVYDINNANVAAGNCEQGANGETFPVRWTASLPGSAPQRLNPVGAHPKATASVINHSGVVAGASIDSNGGGHAVIWKAGKVTPTTLPELGLLPPLIPSSTECSVADMSDGADPVVVGSCELRDGGRVAVKWESGLLGYRAIELPRMLGGSNCVAAAVNSRGQVAGTCENATGDIVAIRWFADGQRLTWLDYLESTGVSREQLSVADMNEAGVVLGNYLTDDGLGRAFVWAPTDDPASEAALDLGGLGGFWTKAFDIADNGYVVGIGQNDVGLSEAFVWTPQAEISGMGTLGGFTSGAAALSDNGSWWVGASQTVEGYVHAYRDGTSKTRPVPSRNAALAQRGKSSKTSSEGKDASKYNSINVAEILKNDRLRTNYINCLLKKGRCAPDAHLLRPFLPVALGGTCSTCESR
ncbi:MAG: hypothetical protein ACREP7_06515 [Lysobacter sp.]